MTIAETVLVATMLAFLYFKKWQAVTKTFEYLVLHSRAGHEVFGHGVMIHYQWFGIIQQWISSWEIQVQLVNSSKREHFLCVRNEIVRKNTGAQNFSTVNGTLLKNVYESMFTVTKIKRFTHSNTLKMNHMRWTKNIKKLLAIHNNCVKDKRKSNSFDLLYLKFR